MTDFERVWVSYDILRMFEELNKCLNDAGGIPMTADKLQTMTALEFFCMIAPNRISFTYTPASG